MKKIPLLILLAAKCLGKTGKELIFWGERYLKGDVFGFDIAAMMPGDIILTFNAYNTPKNTLISVCLQRVILAKAAVGSGNEMWGKGGARWFRGTRIRVLTQQSPGAPNMGTTIASAKTKPASWNAFSDIDAFVDVVVAELDAMKADGIKVRTNGPKPPMDDESLRKAIMAIWCVAFCGMQWRAIGRLAGIPFGTLHALFSRWTRLGLWNRLMLRLSVAWRVACGDDPMPSSLVVDSRSCRSAPTCGFRGIDGGKNVRGVKIHIAVDKHGSPFAVEVSPANEHDAKGVRPVLEQISDIGFEGGALGDLGYRGAPLDGFAKGLGMLGVDAVAGGRGGSFVPAGIRWVVERTFAWASRYRRLNTIFERNGDHIVAFFEIMAASILSRRLARLVKP